MLTQFSISLSTFCDSSTSSTLLLWWINYEKVKRLVNNLWHGHAPKIIVQLGMRVLWSCAVSVRSRIYGDAYRSEIQLEKICKSSSMTNTLIEKNILDINKIPFYSYENYDMYKFLIASGLMIKTFFQSIHWSILIAIRIERYLVEFLIICWPKNSSGNICLEIFQNSPDIFSDFLKVLGPMRNKEILMKPSIYTVFQIFSLYFLEFIKIFRFSLIFFSIWGNLRGILEIFSWGCKHFSEFLRNLLRLLGISWKISRNSWNSVRIRTDSKNLSSNNFLGNLRKCWGRKNTRSKGLIFGWGSKFGTTKCRTTDISKFQNCEY